jgi:hypothetical protein
MPPPIGSSLLSVDMGLTITPYQIRTSANTDLNQRFRRLHMRAPLRPLIAPTSGEYPPPLEINTRSLTNNVGRRQSLLFSSPSLVNIESNQNRTLSLNVLNHRLRQRK